MNRKWIATLFSAIMLLASVPGCAGETEDQAAAPDAALPQSSSAAQPSSAAEAAADGMELFNAYIDINNMMIGEVYPALETYFGYVAEQAEFTLFDPDYGCYPINSARFEQLESVYRIAGAKADKDTLDQTFLAMYPSIKTVMAAINGIEEYTRLKSFKEDGYAKGKEYHAVLWPAYQEFEILGEAYLNEVAAAANARREDNLQRMKDEGYEALYAMNRVIDTAGEILDAIDGQGINDSNLMGLDAEALQPLYDTYVREAAGCRDILGDEEQVKSEGLDSTNTSLFASKLEETEAALIDLWDRVRMQEPGEESRLDLTAADAGTIRNFSDLNNELIELYNNVIAG